MNDPQMVFVIGAGRSGTTILSDLIGMHDDFLKMDEKRYTWMYGAYWQKHDIRTEKDATQEVRAYIRGYFSEHMKGKCVKYVVEKTPSNCFRIPFLNRIYPNAKYVNIIRDGRACAFSSMRAYVGDALVDISVAKIGTRSVKERFLYLLYRFPEFIRRIRYRDLPISGWLPYCFEKGKDVLAVMSAKKPPVWGVRYPGIYADRKVYSSLELAGIQWRESVMEAHFSLKKYINQGNAIHVRYEDLISNPKKILSDIYAFLEVNATENLLKEIERKVVNKRKNAWENQLVDEDLNTLLKHIAPLLHALGYIDNVFFSKHSKSVKQK